MMTIKKLGKKISQHTLRLFFRTELEAEELRMQDTGRTWPAAARRTRILVYKGGGNNISSRTNLLEQAQGATTYIAVIMLSNSIAR